MVARFAVVNDEGDGKDGNHEKAEGEMDFGKTDHICQSPSLSSFHLMNGGDEQVNQGKANGSAEHPQGKKHPHGNSCFGGRDRGDCC